MKLRIKGNSIRIRLTRSEVDYFGDSGYLAEKTEFGPVDFIYELKTNNDIEELVASFDRNKITLLVPTDLAKEWVNSDRVGCDGEMEIGNGKKLFLLLEKDFKCLDNTLEDQSDNYENPLADKHGRG